MPGSEFGERQYELAANLELLSGSGAFFTPTTSMEGLLGIDAALTPGDPRVWRLLGLSPPGGVAAGRGTFAGWPAAAPQSATPPFLISLFVQYKRSAHLTRSTAKEWSTHGSPYWRVELSPRQHETLQKLETAVGAQAAVRYAAPKFWRHQEMWQFQGAGGVLDRSMLFSPNAVARRHTRLTWNRSVGLIGHSEPEEIPVEEPEGLAREIQRRLRERPIREPPRSHFEALAEAVVEVAPSRRSRDEWQDVVAAEPATHAWRGRTDVIAPLADMALIAEAAHATGASWLVLAVSERASPTEDEPPTA